MTNYLRGYVTKCPQAGCKAGYINGQLCECCNGVGRIVIPSHPKDKPISMLWIALICIGMFLVGAAAFLYWMSGLKIDGL